MMLRSLQPSLRRMLAMSVPVPVRDAAMTAMVALVEVAVAAPLMRPRLGNLIGPHEM